MLSCGYSAMNGCQCFLLSWVVVPPEGGGCCKDTPPNTTGSSHCTKPTPPRCFTPMSLKCAFFSKLSNTHSVFSSPLSQGFPGGSQMLKWVGTLWDQLEGKDPRPPFTLWVPLSYGKAGEKLGQEKASSTKVVFINRPVSVPLSRGRSTSQSLTALLHPLRPNCLPTELRAESAWISSQCDTRAQRDPQRPWHCHVPQDRARRQ